MNNCIFPNVSWKISLENLQIIVFVNPLSHYYLNFIVSNFDFCSSMYIWLCTVHVTNSMNARTGLHGAHGERRVGHGLAAKVHLHRVLAHVLRRVLHRVRVVRVHRHVGPDRLSVRVLHGYIDVKSSCVELRRRMSGISDVCAKRGARGCGC